MQGKPELIDTHCHFNHEMMRHDTAETLERARAADVARMIVVGFDLKSSAEAVLMAETYPGVLYAAVGIHPHDASQWSYAASETISQLAQSRVVVAIGEIGLDFYRDLSPRSLQAAAFRGQRQLAEEMELPIIIHCRDAYDELLTEIESEASGRTNGVMHCWAGTPDQAHRSVELGLCLGIGGTVTFKNAESIRAVAASVDLSHLILETDSPYLSPMPFRGRRNEPANVSLVAARIAELRGLTEEEIARATSENALQLFPKMRGA